MKKAGMQLLILLLLVGMASADQKSGPLTANTNLLKPTIHAVTQHPSIGGLHHFANLSGNFFGNGAGAREVRLGNYVLETKTWAMQEIETSVPYSVPFGQKYPVLIWDKAASKAVSNEIKFLLRIMLFPPDHANAQSSVVISTAMQNIGDSQGTRKVKFGNTTAQVVSWSIHSITVAVPSLYPGTYDCCIEDNGEVVSYVLPIKILPPLVK